MQTFVPYANVSWSARVLDRQRLGKQRVEVLQILKALSGESSGWANHPAVQMWRGYENALVEYGMVMCGEWMARGYRDSCYGKIASYYDTSKLPVHPWWWGGPIHATHRAALLHKDNEHYRRFGWAEEPAINYYWPTKVEVTGGIH